MAEVADSVPAESAASGGGDLFGLDVNPQQDQPPETKFQVLAEDANLKMVRHNFLNDVKVALVKFSLSLSLFLIHRRMK